MTYLNTNTRTTSPTSNENFKPLGRTATLLGVFLGYVKRTDDIQRMGRLKVWIPELGSAPDDIDGWVNASYCSPFAGATNVNTTSQSDLASFEGTQTSYGMWMIPPDIDNQVLVMFINGESHRAIWFGVLYNQFVNHMIPGMAASPLNYQYPGKNIPVAEYNKWDKKITNPDRAIKPYEKTKFKGLGNQGLITDPNRGITDSSARREAPSEVFGILTPGPKINDNAADKDVRRKGGSSFIMDDAVGSEYVQLVTKSGAQININETNGFIYLINRDGTAWVQMDQKGNVDIFGATNISMRAQRDFNIRADRNINIEAGQNIYMKAAKDTIQETTTFTYDVNNVPKPSTIPVWNYVGENKGEGGNIVIQALNDMHSTVEQNSYLTVKYQNHNVKVAKSILTNAGESQNYTAGSSFLVKSPEFGVTANSKFNSPVDIMGTLKVGGSANIGSSLLVGGSASVASTLNANTVLCMAGGGAGFIAGYAQIAGSLSNVPPPPSPTISSPQTPVTPAAPGAASAAEIKPLTDKINILATWHDPETKFKRNAKSMQTTVTRLPTYETCPEHESFTYKSTNGYKPIMTEGDQTYNGSSAPGNDANVPPPADTTPGANNTEIPPESPADNAATKDFNLNAYRCQLMVHEGVKYVSYYDTRNLLTAGIGHLLRANEISKYPLGTAVSKEQVNAWFEKDSVSSIKGAQNFLGMDTWGELSDVRKRAVADLCYNMGYGGLSQFVRFRAAMKAGKWDLAVQSLRESKWYGQVGRRAGDIITMVGKNIDPLDCDKKFPPQ